MKHVDLHQNVKALTHHAVKRQMHGNSYDYAKERLEWPLKLQVHWNVNDQVYYRLTGDSL